MSKAEIPARSAPDARLGGTSLFFQRCPREPLPGEPWRGQLAQWAAEEGLSQQRHWEKGHGELGRRRWVFGGRQQRWQHLCSCWSSPAFSGMLGEDWGLCSPEGG